MKTKYNLPKPHLSYSQMSMWMRNKDQYRQRYYMDGPSFENRETIFGKRFAQMVDDYKKGKLNPLDLTTLERAVLEATPLYSVTEHPISLLVSGVPFLGYIDSFEPETCSIIELKTGKEPWDAVRVHKHEQLVVYSLLAKLASKKVDPVVKLVWIQTCFSPVTHSIGSRSIETDGDVIEFTGKIEIFERRIAQWERDAMRKQIVRVAEEISADYTAWQLSPVLAS